MNGILGDGSVWAMGVLQHFANQRNAPLSVRRMQARCSMPVVMPSRRGDI